MPNTSTSPSFGQKFGPFTLRTPFARAVVPVLAGAGLLVLIGLLTWGVAAWISRGGADATERLAPARFEVGTAENAARIVADEGPIMFPGLNTTTGERTLVLDHTGDDPTRGWQIFYAYPVGRPDCPVEQIVGSRDFIDCDGTTIGVADLSPPASGVFPVVENQRTLYIDLVGATTPGTTG